MVEQLLIVFILILANGFFSGAEMAIVASRKGRLRRLAGDGDQAAQKALDLASSPDKFLPTVQIGITLVGTLAAAYGGSQLVSRWWGGGSSGVHARWALAICILADLLLCSEHEAFHRDRALRLLVDQ